MGFIAFNGLEKKKNLEVSKISVSGHIAQVSLQYKVGATPELGPHFREVSPAGAGLTIKVVSALRYKKSLPLLPVSRF